MTIDFSQAEYVCAAHQRNQWPPDSGGEVAFAGRSNVGKSSALNAITRRRRLAHTGKTPGRTRQIVFFDLPPHDCRLVDLPGYGYAKAAHELRRHWQQFIADYLAARRCLKGMIVPMDIRRPLTDLDQTMLQCCWQHELPLHILLTKADKLKAGRARAILRQVRAQLATQPHTDAQLFSAIDKQGVDQAREVITAWLLPHES